MFVHMRAQMHANVHAKTQRLCTATNITPLTCTYFWFMWLKLAARCASPSGVLAVTAPPACGRASAFGPASSSP